MDDYQLKGPGSTCCARAVAPGQLPQLWNPHASWPLGPHGVVSWSAPLSFPSGTQMTGWHGCCQLLACGLQPHAGVAPPCAEMQQACIAHTWQHACWEPLSSGAAGGVVCIRDGAAAPSSMWANGNTCGSMGCMLCWQLRLPGTNEHHL